MAAKSVYGSVNVFGWEFEHSEIALKAHGLISCGIRHMLVGCGDRSRATELVILHSHWRMAYVESRMRARAEAKAQKAAKPCKQPACTCVAICRLCRRFYPVYRKGLEAYINRSGESLVEGACSEACRREQLRLDRRQWRQQSKVHRVSKMHSKRARLYGVTYVNGITAETVARRDHNTCQICKRKVLPYKGIWHARMRTVGHIVAMSQGGSHTWDNVQCECMQCNTRKGIAAKGQLCMPFAA